MGYAYDLAFADQTLYDPPYTPVYPAYLRKDVPMVQQIRQRDVLLFYPYHPIPLTGTVAPRQNPVKRLLGRALGWAASGRS